VHSNKRGTAEGLATVHDDLVERQFNAAAPNLL
jgi:hypothetical protein